MGRAMLSVGSVCSGAGGFDLGFRNAGYRTAWLCEFDPWRQQLLAKNFPGVKCWPDLSTLDPADLERPDVLIGGTPCQDLSVAGQRAGLDGERSGLFWDYMRVRNELGIEWCVWENVAGALSSNAGLDFASVLGALVGADVTVPAGGWPGAGVASGPWGGACWRLLDAQHFGVPQRRRRVFVVGHLGGPCPPEVLLEPTGGRGDLEARGGSRAGAPAALVSGTLGARGKGGGNTADIDRAGAYVANGVAAPLTRGSSSPGVSEPGRRKEDDWNLAVVGTDDLRGGVQQPGRADGAGSAIGPPDPEATQGDSSATGRQHPEHEERNGLVEHDPRPVVQRRGSSVRDGAPIDADGVRAPDGLAGRVDDPAVTVKLSHTKSNGSNLMEDRSPALSETAGRLAVFGAGAEGNASAHDPQPDGRRYAACGDGVVSNVAEWIARRLAEVIELVPQNDTEEPHAA